MLTPETIEKMNAMKLFGLVVWSKYSNAQRVRSLHVSRIDADIEDREAA